ncbi:hypothetical protein [Actinoplanes sp. NPDC049265]|uniref:hypothetical protein n=1 Tax=Actinoplanes sp. NPDC049265 TaxID=3363902 RepID=UPI003720DB8F
MAATDIDVVVPARRAATVSRLLMGLAAGDDRPDLVTLIGHEVPDDQPAFGLTVRLLRPASTRYPIGDHDVAVRRNIGIWRSPCARIIGLDDDVVPAADTVAACRRLLAEDAYVWGHHRYRDLSAVGTDPELVARLVHTPAGAGRSRELGVNRWHLYQSCYAGMFAARRDELIASGGFDLAYCGRHAGEDQDLGLRLARRIHGREQVFIHEPPFAWHPEQPEPWGPPGWTNLCSGGHRTRSTVRNGLDLMSCLDCPWMTTDRPPKATDPLPLLAFDPGQASATEVWLKD